MTELVDDIFDTNANFGYDVALDGDLLVVGAQLLDRVSGTYQNEGGAYVFRRNASNVWNQAGKLFRVGAQDNERAGSSVAIEGTRIIVGATSVDGAGLARGAAYVFENPTQANNGWSQVAELTASDAADSDSFGTAVSLLGGSVWVGAQGHNASAGQMYRYDVDQGGIAAWGETEVYAHSAPATNQWLGSSIAATTEHVAVGAFGIGGKGAVLVYPAPGGGASAVGGHVPGAAGPVSAHPNPFNPATTLAFSLESRSEVEVLIHDLRGALVASLFRGTLDAGAHALTWRADAMPSGLYLATVRTGMTMRTTQITLMK
ncbi:MAG: FG-GAP repeat protein [bacterium]|nr:FG-GAP repeat protein [bacterium]